MKRALIALLFAFPAYAADTTISGVDSNGLPQGVRVESGQIGITNLECEDDELNHCRVSLAANATRVNSATSTELKEGAGEMVGFYVASTSSGTIVFYDDNDGTCSSGQKTGTITPAVGWHFLPIPFSTAICALTASTIDVVFVWK